MMYSFPIQEKVEGGGRRRKVKRIKGSPGGREREKGEKRRDIFLVEGRPTAALCLWQFRMFNYVMMVVRWRRR